LMEEPQIAGAVCSATECLARKIRTHPIAQLGCEARKIAAPEDVPL
jgi:hypothetical protein